MKTSPYRITKANAEKSPMKTIENVKKALRQYHQNESIGFSKESSLKSMGLIPRKNGYYILGEKYSSYQTKTMT